MSESPWADPKPSELEVVEHEVERIRKATIKRLELLGMMREMRGGEAVSSEEVDLVFRAGIQMGEALRFKRFEAGGDSDSLLNFWTIVPVDATAADRRRIKKKIRRELQEAFDED